MNRIAYAIIIIVVTVTFQACATSPVPMFYRGAEIKGQVVDADTKEPIEGVVVVAKWELYCANPVDGSHCKVLHVYEAVTDKEGRYSMPSWGPKMRPRKTYLTHFDPYTLYFKKGYEASWLINSDPERFYKYYKSVDFENISFKNFEKRVGFTRYEHHRSLRESVWDGRTIEMKRFEGSNRDLFHMLNSIYSDIIDEEEIPLMKVKYTSEEWARAVKDLKAPFSYKELPDRVLKVIEEEQK
jgi:hypothetical protein